MKKILLAGLLFTAVQSYAQSTFETLAIGSTIPMGDVNMKSTEGKQVSLNNAKTDNGLIVMFSCNTCPYVIKSQPRTKEVMEYAKAHEIGMVIINSNEAQRGEADSYEAMVKYAKKQGYTVPYVVDEKSKLADAFGASHTPEVFLFDANGKLIYKGAMEDNPGSPADSKVMYLKKAMDNMLAELPVDPNTTKSIGCSIKRS